MTLDKALDLIEHEGWNWLLRSDIDGGCHACVSAPDRRPPQVGAAMDEGGRYSNRELMECGIYHGKGATRMEALQSAYRAASGGATPFPVKAVYSGKPIFLIDGVECNLTGCVRDENGGIEAVIVQNADGSEHRITGNYPGLGWRGGATPPPRAQG